MICDGIDANWDIGMIRWIYVTILPIILLLPTFPSSSIVKLEGIMRSARKKTMGMINITNGRVIKDRMAEGSECANHKGSNARIVN